MMGEENYLLNIFANFTRKEATIPTTKIVVGIVVTVGLLDYACLFNKVASVICG